MFWNKHPESSFALSRFGTIITRSKDSSIISSIIHMTNVANMNFDDLMDWIFDKTMGDEFRKIFKPDEELDYRFSYVHYISALRLALKSPYSATESPMLHIWIHMTCALLGSTRSICARIPEEVGLPKIRIFATLVAFSRRETVLKPKNKGQNTADSASGIEETSGEYWYMKFISNGSKLTTEQTDFYNERAEAMKTGVRERTIGDFKTLKLLYSSFPNIKNRTRHSGIDSLPKRHDNKLISFRILIPHMSFNAQSSYFKIPGEVTQLRNEAAAKTSKALSSRKGPVEKMINPGRRALNKNERKSPNFGFEKLRASESVKAERISSRFYEESSTGISEMESPRKRSFKEVRDPGSKTKNSKKRKNCDRAIETSTVSVPSKAKIISTQLQNEFGKCASKMELSRKRHFEERKGNLEETSDKSPSQTVNSEQSKISSLAFEDSSSSVHVKSKCISTRLDDKSDIYISGNESLRKRPLEGMSNPGTEGENPPKKHCDRSFKISNALLPVKPESKSTLLIDDLGTFTSKIKASRKMHFEEKKNSIEERSDQGLSKVVNPEQIKTHDLISENSDSSVPVKTKCISVRSYDKSGSESEALRKRNFEKISDPGPEAVNKKKRKTWDVSFENLSTSMPVKAELVSRLLQDTWDYTLDNYYETHCVSNGKLRLKKSKEADELILEPYLNLAKHILLSKSGTEEDLWWAENWLKLFGKSETTKDLKRALKLKQIAIAKVKHLFQNDIKLDSVNARADYNHMNEFQETALDLAVTTKNLTLVKLLMPLGGIDEVELHQRLHYIAGMESNYISELLAIAVEVNRRKFIKVLVSNGANFGQCLHIAVENENKYTCEELIKNGADINARNEKNETPLDLALKTGKFDIVKVFGT
ncbi:hypothetical protein QYM36_006262 [Artemia franciscana]|uniref:Rhabdovirus nucleocapsid domain-containing protein n=2 Tax=Artemia franciscana TaxID=6661 RepID=A0AA88L9M0_ARTSF|nr:hypothetical protein QYM36_006262 [Artemia franciscana]